MRPERHFELFAVETVRDLDTGNVLKLSHAFVVSERIDGETPEGAQLTFDNWLERELFWEHHLERGDMEAAYADEKEHW